MDTPQRSVPLAGVRYVPYRSRVVIVVLLAMHCVLLSGCGFQRQGTTQLPERLRTLSLQSDDPYSHWTRAVRYALQYQGFTVLAPQTITQGAAYPCLQLLTTSENRAAVSVFPDGKGAQYQITYRVSAQLSLAAAATPSQQASSQKITLQIATPHTFFDNPAIALAKESEQEIIRQQLYQQAARQLVSMLIVTLMKSTSTLTPPAITPTPHNHATPSL